jgi:PAS domain S-box-containing protein
MTLTRRSSLFRDGVTVFNILLATGLTQMLWNDLRQTPLVLFVIAIGVSVLAGGLRTGLLAAMLAALSCDFFFSAPIDSLDLSLAGLIRLGGLMLVAVGVHVPTAARQRAEAAQRRMLVELEARVAARTSQLSVTNARLLAEIAERERAEEALRSSERYYRSLIENTSDIITILNRDGKIRYESSAVARQPGCPQSEVIGTNSLRLIHPDDAPRVGEAFTRLLNENQPGLSIEYRVRHRDESWRIMESVAANCLDDPAVRGVIITSRDITARRRAEEALRQSEERYRAFVCQSSEGIWRCECETPVPVTCSEAEQAELFYEVAYIAECNEAMARRLGFQHPGELLGRKLKALLPQSEPPLREFIQAFIRSGYRLVDRELRLTDGQGGTRYLSNTITGMVENGLLVRAWGTQLDITESRRAEEALRSSEARLREVIKFTEDVINSAGEGIMVMDRGKRFVLWNRVMEEKLGMAATQMPGRCADEVFPELTECGLDEQVLNGETVTGPDLEVHRPDGSAFWRSVTFAPHRNSEGGITGLIALMHDITERKRAEKQLAGLLAREQAARHQAETASRLKDEFLATVSHELRTPLSAIVGWARLLRGGSVRAEKIPYALETIERNAQVQTQLINDLLDVSRIISGKLLIEPAPVDLASVIVAAVGTIRPAAEARSIRLELELAAEPLVVSGEADRLQQVAWNLLSNAVKFTPPGGRIAVSLKPADGQAQLTVRDTGQGIPAEFLPCVFDRFSQADSSITRRHGGLGLGLAIVRHLVELHGGTVQAESAGRDAGASFTVLLPLPEGRSQQPAPGRSETALISGS